MTEVEELRSRLASAEARIARVEAQLEAGPPSAFSGVKVQGYNWCSDAVRAALTEPVEPQPSACATCGDERYVCEKCGDNRPGCANDLIPCPSCTPPDHAPHRGAEIDCCEDDPDAWFAVCPECGWQSPQGRSRHEVATALAHHQANPAAPPDRTPAPPDPESETP